MLDLNETVIAIANKIQNLRFTDHLVTWTYENQHFAVEREKIPAVYVPQDPLTKQYLANKYGHIMQ